MSIAFFDFDETVITGKSMFLFLQEYSCHRRLQCGLSFNEIMEKIYFLKKKGSIREDINRYYYSLFKNENQFQVRMMAKNIFDKGIYKFNTEVLKKIRYHQHQNDDVVFVSGAMKDIIYPVMENLGVKNSLCSEPIISNGCYTGVLNKVSIGYHKAEYARYYAKKNNQPLVECYAYGDHISDIDLLKLVGHPCAVNPSPELLTEAEKQRWPILYSHICD